MSCSKLFSGDLPELIYKIIKYFRDDFSTLHSCILVNRLWCRLTIPLLWENPFSTHTKNYNFIEIYLVNLKSDLKTKLNEYKIINNLLPSNTLFNYPSFLKYLNIHDIIISIKKFEAVTRTSLPKNRNERLVDIYKSLFEIFIENEVNLHTLEIDINYLDSIHYENILELILQNPNFIHNIKNINFYISDNNGNAGIKNRILQIISLQQNLKKIFIGHSNFLSYQSLLLSKDYNCSNTLNTIIFYKVNFNGINNLKEIFEQLNVLESIHINECYSLNTDFTQQIINLTKPFKLKSLFISRISQIHESLQLLLQISGSYLENFGYDSKIIYYDKSLILPKQQLLLELILKYCKNIKYLDFYTFENEIIYSALNLIENVKQNLNYLIIKNTSRYNRFQLIDLIERSATILRNLGQNLPPKLEYLNFNLNIKASDMKVFLKNSQNTLIKKLLISYIQEDSDNDDILPYIKEYIMKEKRVEYLAIKGYFFKKGSKYGNKDGDLSYLKDEVEEFKLYDIKVRNYYDLLPPFSDYHYDFAKKIR